MIKHLPWLFGPKSVSQVTGNLGGHFWSDFTSMFKASVFHWVVSLKRKHFLSNISCSLGGVLPLFRKLAAQFRVSCLALEDINSPEWAIFDPVPLCAPTKQCQKTFRDSEDAGQGNPGFPPWFQHQRKTVHDLHIVSPAKLMQVLLTCEDMLTLLSLKKGWDAVLCHSCASHRATRQCLKIQITLCYRSKHFAVLPWIGFLSMNFVLLPAHIPRCWVALPLGLLAVIMRSS